MRKFVAAAVLTVGVLLSGCDDPEVAAMRTRFVAVVPPNTLYQCPAKPAVPDPETLTDRKVAEYVVKLENGYRICSRSLRAIKAFADGAALRVSDQK